MSIEKFEIEFITIVPEFETSNEIQPIIHYKNSRRNKIPWDRNKYEEKKIVWSLMKYAGKSVYNGIDWRPQGSLKELNDLSTVKIVEKLNTKNLFDFEYFPEEKDYLYIAIEYANEEIKKRSRPYVGGHISFIFEEGKWTINAGYDQMGSVYKNFKEGIVKYVA